MTLIWTVLLALAAATHPVPQYHCLRIKQPPAIDGLLDDAAWKAAPWTSEFVDVATAEQPSQRTVAKLCWDADNLYIAAELAETDVQAKMTKHDDRIFLEQAFEVFIDPDGDGKNYAELEFNALGTAMDLIMTKPYKQRGRADMNWSAQGMKIAVHVDGTINDASDQDKGWTVELAIPWKAIKQLAPEAIPPKPGDEWRIELARVRPEGEKSLYWAWAATGERNYHVPAKWGIVQFSE